jgi:hypothetical protein
MLHQLEAATQRAMVWSEVRFQNDHRFGTVEEYEGASTATRNLSRALLKLFCNTEHKTLFC